MIGKIIRYVVLAAVVVGIVVVMSTLLNDKNNENGFSSNKTYTVSIRVMDKETKKFITGGEFVLKTSAGEIIEEWVGTENIKRIAKLKNGTYVIEQKSAADGYEVADDVKFKIYNEGKDVTIYNEVKVEEEKYESEEVVVDNTLSMRSCISYIGSVLIIGFGILLINKRKFYFE